MLCREGRLVAVSRFVLVERAVMANLRCRAAAALLVAGPGSVLTGPTALALRGIDAADVGRIHVQVGYQRRLRTLPGHAVHRGRLDEQDLREEGGLRLVTLEHAVAEVLCRGPRGSSFVCVDEVMARTTEAERAALRAEIAHRIATRPDPRGRRRAETLISLATGRAESPGESLTLLALYDARLPIPDQQVSVRDLDGRERYRLDFGWLEARVGLEYDGHAAHLGRAELDAVRDEDLRRRGWLIIRVRADDVADPSRMIEAVRVAFARRRYAA